MRIALVRSRAKERAVAAAGETQGRTRPPRYRQKEKPLRSNKRNSTSNLIAKKRPHAVKKETHHGVAENTPVFEWWAFGR
jgi:hypothetical protein